MQNEKSSIEKVLESTVKNVSSIIEVDKIVGSPVKNEKGQTAIPVSKLTVGLICGGGEYGDVKVIKESGENFAGGAVTIASVKPQCFLIDNGDGFKVINESGEGLEAFLKAIAKFIGNVKL